MLAKFKFKMKRMIGVKCKKEKTKKRLRLIVLMLSHQNALRNLPMRNLFRRLFKNKSFLYRLEVRNTYLPSARCPCPCQDQCPTS